MLWQSRTSAMLATLLALAHARPMSRTLPWRRQCALPSWTIKDLSVVFSDDSFVPGNATFDVTSSLTNQTERLRCEVPFNYLGFVNGTPANGDLNIVLQFNIDTATVTLNQTWACGNQTAGGAAAYVSLAPFLQAQVLCRM